MLASMSIALLALTAAQAAAPPGREGADEAARPAFEKRHTEILSTFYKGTSKKHAVRRTRRLPADSCRT